ncbi:fused MFS/spermidine synthase [Ideonella sp. DXS22W]|uniref:Fused MFS/spermidine synthase n=1 Tax=Pseudaquabacterium inlustre TaxID=2984192 RepID=A0ABU9CDR7_9BURK
MSPWLLMAASGFAGLGWQIVWTQQCALWLGHESAAVLAVVAAFFGGLALGAWGLGGRIARSARPGVWYVGCEAVIALWGLALVPLMPRAADAALALTGPQPDAWWQWSVAFAGAFTLLLPATAAMGATLPAMARIAQALRRGGAPLAALYAANTAGAVLGVLATAFWLVPELGLLRTSLLCAALNAGCALLAWRWWGRAAATTTVDGSQSEVEAGPSPDGHRVLARLAATGLLGIGYEVGVVRVISQVAEDTVYTFALLLAVYLVGTALGAAAWARWTGRGLASGPAPCSARAALHTDRLLVALATACLLGAGSLWAAESLKAATLAALGPGLGSALAAEALLALAAFGLPTLVMGALFSQLAERATHAGQGLGRALGVNTLGAALAPVLLGVGLLPLAGAKVVLLSIAAGYLVLVAPRQWARPLPWVPAVAAALLALAAPPLVFIEQPEGGQVLSYQEGAMAAVSVVADDQGVARLRINNRQQEGSSSSLQADGRQALLPLLLHPAPQRALFLGLGTGLTASAAVQDRGLRVDAVELLPEVVAAATLFQPAWADPTAAGRLQVQVADARRFVRTAPQRYDLIVADNFHPARSGSGALYTVQHFQAVRARLAAGGLFCQWLPLHQLDEATLRSIVASFRAAFPQGRALLASHSLATPVIGLLGHADEGTRVDPAQVRQRLVDAATWPVPPAAFGLHDEWAVLGSVVAGPAALARLAGDAALNTDDRPVVAYRAPRVTYAPDGTPRDRLLALLPQLRLAPGELLVAGQAGAEQRLAAYRAASARFLWAGRDVRPASDVRQMLAQVGPPLLAVLGTSPDFRPAYDPLLGMARALAAQDGPAARALLTQLVQLQPARPEAAQLLQGL